MCFDSEPLGQAIDLVGRVRVHVSLSADQPMAQMAVRLCDLRPDGTSALIAHGFLNLRQRNGADRMEDMPVGQVQDVSVLLDQAAYNVPAGHQCGWPCPQAISPLPGPKRIL